MLCPVVSEMFQNPTPWPIGQSPNNMHATIAAVDSQLLLACSWCQSLDACPVRFQIILFDDFSWCSATTRFVLRVRCGLWAFCARKELRVVSSGYSYIARRGTSLVFIDGTVHYDTVPVVRGARCGNGGWTFRASSISSCC